VGGDACLGSNDLAFVACCIKHVTTLFYIFCKLHYLVRRKLETVEQVKLLTKGEVLSIFLSPSSCVMVWQDLLNLNFAMDLSGLKIFSYKKEMLG
jgi:hypothetical protein